VRLGLRRDNQLITRLFHRCGLVEPFHFGKKRLAGELRLGRQCGRRGCKIIGNCEVAAKRATTESGCVSKELPAIGVHVFSRMRISLLDAADSNWTCRYYIGNERGRQKCDTAS